MSQNPINLAVRFALEIIMLVALGMWARQQQTGWKGVLLAILLPLVAASLWGIFRTQGDHGKGLVDTPGVIRLLMELFLFSAAVWALYDLNHKTSALVFAITLMIHYLVSYDRVLSLIKGF